MKRFIVKKVKIVWRNSMLAGNPIERSFVKYGIYDRNWQEDHYCYCPYPCGEWSTNNGQSRKFRLVIDDEAKAKRIADTMNALTWAIKGDKAQIEFGIETPTGIKCLTAYIRDEDILHLRITKYRQ